MASKLLLTQKEEEDGEVRVQRTKRREGKGVASQLLLTQKEEESERTEDIELGGEREKEWLPNSC